MIICSNEHSFIGIAPLYNPSSSDTEWYVSALLSNNDAV